MRIGIDGRLGYKEGIGRYLFEMVENISIVAPDNQYILYFNSNHPDHYTQHAPRRQNIQWRFIEGSPFKFREHINLARAIRHDHLDLYHATFEYGAPIGVNTRLVLTIHDAYFSPPSRSMGYFRSFSTYFYYQVMMLYGIIKASHIITVSSFTREKIFRQCRLLNRYQNKITFIHNGVGKEFATAKGQHREYPLLNKYGIQRYFLYLGALTNHKNIFGLLAGYGVLYRQLPDCPPLVVAGKPHKNMADLSALIDAEKITDKVVFLGFVPNEELPGLFRGADVFVFPSLHEGFGIPVLEAMACGTPVITSNTTALPEVAGDAALLVDPSKPEEIGQAMLTLCQDEAMRHRLSKLGVRRAQEFSWEKMARETLAIYQKFCI